MKKFLVSIVILSGVLIGPASAQSPEESALEPFEKCQAIAQATERLACFDAALVEAKQLAITSRDQRRARTRDDFGLSTFEIADQDVERTANDPETIQQRREQRAELEPNKIQTELSDFYVGSRSRKRIFVLTNGQMWQETSPNRLSRSPKAGAKVVIAKSGFGGFRMKIGKSKKVLSVKRLK